MASSHKLNIKVFADGADLDGIKEMYANPKIGGFTTNPTLMRMAGVDDYEAFAKSALEVVTDRPISFEVFADDLVGMEKQARRIASWGPNVNVKIPVTNTKGESTASIVKSLSADGVQLNVTAIMSLDQVRTVGEALHPDTPSIVSVFAGRIADAVASQTEFNLPLIPSPSASSGSAQSRSTSSGIASSSPKPLMCGAVRPDSRRSSAHGPKAKYSYS